ncbi:MAG: corrinoid protein [Candidatus Korarchaeota archaeon]|nr:corrinoid protein [Candidatus Korarchaeota archaeon]
MLDELKDQLKEALIDLDEERFSKVLKELLSAGEEPWSIILGPMSEAMEEIGKLYEEGEYFIAEMLVAADIFKKALKEMKIEEMESDSSLGVVVIGTVKGDVHDIGKSLVSTMLRAAGFKVIDLGVDVDADKFIEAVKEYDADIVAMSALLTTTRNYMKVVIDRLKEENLRDRVKVLIGGLSTTKEFANEIGADGWGKNAIDGVEVAKKLVGFS